MFSTSYLFASLVWGMAGMGYFMYGKKQSAMVPMMGGLLLMVISYFISSALLLTAVSVAIIVGIHWGLRQGY